MTDKQLRTPVLFATARIALAAALACAAVAAQAQSDGEGAASSPYYVGASLGYTRDTNVYRTPDGFTEPGPTPGTTVPVPPQGDNITSVGLLGGIDQPFGRQHFYASGNVHDNRYSSHDDLNNTSYGLNTGLDWSSMERLSGKLSYLLNNELATYGAGNNIPGFRQKNLQKDQDFEAAVKYGLVSLLTLEGDYGHRQTDYSANAYRLYDYAQDAGSVGLKYHPSDLLTLGVDVRHTRGHYHDRPVPLDNARNDLDLLATWVPTGQSTLSGRLSYSHQTYDNDAGPSFKGATGAASWDYRPTGKLRFVASYARDTGQQAGYSLGTMAVQTPQGLAFQQDLSDTSLVSNMAELRALYDVTAKIHLEGDFANTRRKLSGFVVNSGTTGHDSLQSDTLKATYDIARSVSLSCSWSRQDRSSDVGAASGATLSVSYPFKDKMYGCSAQVLLQ
jgi:hypothetical protein